MYSDQKEETDKAINKEVARLRRIYKNIDEKKKQTIEGLIQRAAFMRISLADLEEDLKTFGFTEYFSQGDQEPYLRKRPTADLYNTLNANYQKIIKQLTDLLPKDVLVPEKDDCFNDFINGREDI